jgi:YidC/Oxa1 family membrane protein insertase
MFTTLIVQPIFNLLVFITAILPGHNFGMAIIVFTLIIRLLMWPLVKKQLHHAKAMRDLAPELKKIKAATKGNRQEESRLTMELYKEKEINPFATIGVLLVQLPILFGLYASIRKLINDPHQIVTFHLSVPTSP